MKIVLSSRGSRGDVYPIIEVAAALQQKGHQVTLCVPKLFEKYAKSRKLTPVLYDEDSQLVMHKMGSGWQATRQALSWFAGDIEEQFDVLLEATRGADALVTSANEPAAPSVSEHRNIPFYRIAYCPDIPGSQPPPLLPWQKLPAIVNRATWKLLNTTIGLVIGRQLDRRRRSLGLRPVGEIGEYFAGRSHTILAISELLAPPSSDWMHTFSYAGYCHSPDLEPLDDKLISRESDTNHSQHDTDKFGVRHLGKKSLQGWFARRCFSNGSVEGSPLFMAGLDNAPRPDFSNDCLKGFVGFNVKIGCFAIRLIGSIGLFFLDEKVRVFPVKIRVVMELLNQLLKFFCCGQPQGSFDNLLYDVFLALVLIIQN